jgi:D-glycero-alpha-D-manno-heptose-7-phosphate kinase
VVGGGDALRRRELPTAFHAAAPLRLDFAGGWTDVPPFSAREGGVVVNAAIALAARVELKLGGPRIRLVAEDLGQELECANAAGLVLDGRLDLLKAALRMFPVQARCTLVTRSDAPPGCGLGASGALDVALVAALALARGERLSERDIAEQAWHLEAVEANIPGGRQDQFAAALGGFHRLSFRDPDVGVEPITLDPAFAAALERQTLLCYTGRARVSGETIARVMAAYAGGDRAVLGALRALKHVAAAMAEALRAADVGRVGGLLAENWRHQQALAAEMCTPEMARLERALAGARVLGGKAAGAGAGGAMFFVTRDDPAPALAAARETGATVLPVRWAQNGVRAW